jgi:VIT1/CCC1 family predicted Fe2+/Mn2+ transporter
MASLSRDLGLARDAYTHGDVTKSIAAHNAPAKSEDGHKGKAGEYIQAIVFGGLDGIITTFAVVVAAAASRLTYGSILIIGFANLLADAIGMAVGDYLSSAAEDEHQAAERAREEWEVANVPEKEQQEMIDVYVKKGIPLAEAREVVRLLWPHKEAFLDLMMIEELGIMPSDQTIVPWKSALATFFSFLLLGGAPMLPYLFSISYSTVGHIDLIFWIACAVFLVTLFILGSLKGVITGKNWFVHGSIMLVTGTVTTALSFFLADYLHIWIDPSRPASQLFFGASL